MSSNERTIKPGEFMTGRKEYWFTDADEEVALTELGKKLWDENVARIYRAMFGDSSRGSIPEEALPPRTRELLNLYLTTREELINALTEQFGSVGSDSWHDEWVDNEADQALEQFRFWWTWGN